MTYFITTDSTGQVTGLYCDGEGYAPIPSTAVVVTDTDAEILHAGFARYKFIAGALSVNPDQDITVRKVSKIAEIDAAYNAAISVISASYPETERNSWPKQEAEARAWTANNTAVTPLLSSIATARGSTIADICARVITNADAYAVYAGGMIGKRQAKMIAIAAATTIVELDAILWI